MKAPSLTLPLALFAAAAPILARQGPGPDEGATADRGPAVLDVAPGADAPDADDANSAGRGDLAAVVRFGRPETWGELLERDSYLTFNLQSVAEARRDLEQDRLLNDRERASALTAMGTLGLLDVRPYLRTWTDGELSLGRQAATLALGELGERDDRYLVSLLDDPDQQVAECALLALLRSGSVTGFAEAERMAEGRGRLAVVARELMSFHANPDESEASYAARLLLELRWDAARRYGYVDGVRWRVHLIDGLCQNRRFLDAVIYQEAATIQQIGVVDHIWEGYLASRSEFALRACVRGLQPQLAAAARVGLWQPENAAEWDVLFDELGRVKTSGSMLEVLRRATVLPEQRFDAILLLARAGEPSVEDAVEELLESGTEAERARLLRALGASGRGIWIPEMTRQRLSADPRVRAAALIAMVRLGHAPANLRLQSALLDAEPRERAELLAELRATSEDNRVVVFLEQVAPLLEGPTALAVYVALAQRGNLAAREPLRAALETSAAGDLAPEIVLALADSPLGTDLQAFKRLFPTEGSFELNVALARALLRQNDRDVTPVLRAAIWSAPWNRSLLACALLTSVVGIFGVETELESAPAGVGETGLRRVGFALGELGGPEMVERLARRRSSGDPALQGAYLGALGARTH